MLVFFFTMHFRSLFIIAWAIDNMENLIREKLKTISLSCTQIRLKKEDVGGIRGGSPVRWLHYWLNYMLAILPYCTNMKAQRRPHQPWFIHCSICCSLQLNAIWRNTLRQRQGYRKYVFRWGDIFLFFLLLWHLSPCWLNYTQLSNMRKEIVMLSPLKVVVKPDSSQVVPSVGMIGVSASFSQAVLNCRRRFSGFSKYPLHQPYEWPVLKQSSRYNRWCQTAGTDHLGS